jgi:hypothetical protein
MNCLYSTDLWRSVIGLGISYRLRYYFRLSVMLLPSKGMQPPKINPTATAAASTSPHGKSIDLQNTNRRLTKLAFWTDTKAIVTTQAATIIEIINFVILILRSQRIRSKHRDSR